MAVMGQAQRLEPSRVPHRRPRSSVRRAYLGDVRISRSVTGRSHGHTGHGPNPACTIRHRPGWYSRSARRGSRRLACPPLPKLTVTGALPATSCGRVHSANVPSNALDGATERCEIVEPGPEAETSRHDPLACRDVSAGYGTSVLAAGCGVATRVHSRALVHRSGARSAACLNPRRLMSTAVYRPNGPRWHALWRQPATGREPLGRDDFGRFRPMPPDPKNPL
jgi:hypothetical protein